MMFAMNYGIVQNPGENIMRSAAKSVLDYVENHHLDLYGFLQNPNYTKPVFPGLFFQIR